MNYYESSRAIGKLFRRIELPALDIVSQAEKEQRRKGQRAQEHDLEELMAGLKLDRSPISSKVRNHVSQYISPGRVDRDRRMMIEAADRFARYSSELQTACATFTLSRTRGVILTEEEAVVGTIVAKTSQPRQRQERMSKLRENTDIVVSSIRDELMGDEEDPLMALGRSWAAWQIGVAEKDAFGAKSFGWIALGGIFEAIKEYENEQELEMQ